MRPLTINLDDVDFDTLFSLGRSIIPTIAPGWTDHNTHDPGIMLVELAAWIADAQIYSLARLRHDERAAYARLMGVHAHGPLPAHGLVWPLASGRAAPWAEGMRIQPHTAIVPDAPDPPPFFATHDVTLTCAEVVRVYTRFADGHVIDWSSSNAQRGAVFAPFGAVSSPQDRLVLDVSAASVPVPTEGRSTLAIGFEIVRADPAAIDSTGYGARIPRRSRLQLEIEDEGGTRPLEVVDDTTCGLLRSGVVLFRFDGGSTPLSRDFSLVMRSGGGTFLVAPKVQRIGLNVLPVRQREQVIDAVADFGNGLPDQAWHLLRDGVLARDDDASIEVRIAVNGKWSTWKSTRDFADHGARDCVFAFDPASATIAFGNGVDGCVPAPGATLSITYEVSAGQRGNLRAGTDWRVGGIAGIFGRNGEPTTGGADARMPDELRAEARSARASAHPIVTSGDLASAALALKDLGVMRALEVAPPTIGGRRVAGQRRLAVVGPHDAGATATTVTEVPDWLAAVQARLAPLLPLGQRLAVSAPRYVRVRIAATLLAAPSVDPAAVAQAAEKMLRAEFAIVRQTPDGSEWPFGREIAVLDIKGRLRRVDGVARVVALEVSVDGAAVVRSRPLAPDGLPLVTVAAGDILVQRASAE